MLIEQIARQGLPSESEGDPHSITVLSYRDPGQRGYRRVGDVGVGLDFRRQLELLDQWGFTTITLNDCRLFYRGELHLPRRPIVLTFDQGGLDLAGEVIPALCDTGGRAVVFLTVGRDIPVDQKRIIHAEGIEFGSLMCSNRPLTELTEDEAMEELLISRERIEQFTGSPVYSCAYPQGETNMAVREWVRRAGYEFAVRGNTPYTVFGSDLLDICRQSVSWFTGRLSFAMRVFSPHRRFLRVGRKPTLILSAQTSALETDKSG